MKGKDGALVCSFVGGWGDAGQEDRAAKLSLPVDTQLTTPAPTRLS